MQRVHPGCMHAAEASAHAARVELSPSVLMCSVMGDCGMPDLACALNWRAGGYFSTTGDDPSILLRMKEDYDGAEPAASSVAVSNLARLAALAAPEEAERLRECAPWQLLTSFV